MTRARSFRFQLALRATTVVALGLGALAAMTVWTIKSLLDNEVDTSILNVASIQAASLADGPSGDMHFHEWELTPAEAESVRDIVQYAQVWNEEGAALLRSQYMTADLPADSDALARATAGELVWTRLAFEGTPMRTVFYPLERLGVAHEAHVLQIAAPLTRRNQMLMRASVFLAVLALLLSVATFMGSWWLAGSAVQPIHAVIDQAEEIEAGSLDQRIEAWADTLEYRRLVEVLNTMLARLQLAFDAQRRFTADASHELRSPLTAMRGEIEVALKRPRTDDEYVEVLESTLEEVVRLSKTSEDLLTLARSDSRSLRLDFQVVDATEVVGHVIGRLKSEADSRGVHVAAETDPVIATVDQGTLGQIAWNLIENALHFSRAGGEVRVLLRNEDERLVLVVEDDGPGFSGVDPESVFERFFREDQARTHGEGAGGTGLGLAIVRALAQAHGGSARAESGEQGGARLTVELSQTR